MIFFDAVGTLIWLPNGVGYHYREVAARHGWKIDEELLTEKFRAAWKTMPKRAPSRGPRPDDDKPWWRELVARVLAGCGLLASSAVREAYFEELYAEFARPGVWSVYPEVFDVLRQLHPRYPLGLISNFDSRLRTVLSQLGLDRFFEHVAISSEAGADKPARQIFEYALALANCRPELALHVGDDPEADWRGAADAGLHVFHLDRATNTLGDLRRRLLS